MQSLLCVCLFMLCVISIYNLRVYTIPTWSEVYVLTHTIVHAHET